MSSYVFSVELYSESFPTKEIELVANYTYTPFSRGLREYGVQMEPDEEEELEINSLKSNSTYPDPLELAIVEFYNDSEDFSELIEAIKNEHL